eukprot:scaffold398135_cov55-Attheya_sp.AAC.1
MSPEKILVTRTQLPAIWYFCNARDSNCARRGKSTCARRGKSTRNVSNPVPGTVMYSEKILVATGNPLAPAKENPPATFQTRTRRNPGV